MALAMDYTTEEMEPYVKGFLTTMRDARASQDAVITCLWQYCERDSSFTLAVMRYCERKGYLVGSDRMLTDKATTLIYREA